MELLNSILYDTVYHSAPIILCVIGGIFAYKANVLNIALEGMMLNGAFVSVLVEYMTGSVAVAIIAAIVTKMCIRDRCITSNLLRFFLPYKSGCGTVFKREID